MLFLSETKPSATLLIKHKGKENEKSRALSTSLGDPLYHFEYRPLQGLLGMRGGLSAARPRKGGIPLSSSCPHRSNEKMQRLFALS